MVNTRGRRVDLYHFVFLIGLPDSKGSYCAIEIRLGNLNPNTLVVIERQGIVA